MPDKPNVPDASTALPESEPKQPEAVQSEPVESASATAADASQPETVAAEESAAAAPEKESISIDAPELDASPLESLIFALRASSSRQLVIEVPSELEEVVEPVEHPEGHVETPARLSSLPEATDEVVADPGLPIPEAYDADMISALVQDPFRIYVYWDARLDTLTSITRLFGPSEVKSFRPVIRITDKKTEEETYYPVKYPGSDWFSVYPDRTYIIEFGVYSADFGFIRLMGAPEVTTPRGTVAPDVAPEPEYRIGLTRFKKVLHASGFQAHAGLLPQETLAEWLPPHVADIFVRAGVGKSLDMVHLDALPESVQSVLEELRLVDDGEMVANSLMHFLPSVLRDSYVSYLAGRGMPTGIRNVHELRDTFGPMDIEGEDYEEIEELEFGEWEEIEDEDFLAPGLLRFGVGSSAGSDLGSQRGRRRRRIPRRKSRRAPLAQREHRPTPWLPSLDRPDSSGGRNRLLPMDFDLPE